MPANAAVPGAAPAQVPEPVVTPDTDPNGYGSLGDDGVLDAIELELTDTVIEPKPAPPAPKPAPKPATVAKTEPVEPVKPKHPDFMVEQAKDLGFEDDFIEALDTVALGKAITREMRKERAELRRDKKVDSATPPVPSDPVEAFWTDQGEVDDEGKRIKVKDVQFHPALKKVLDTIVREVHGIKGHVGQSAQAQAASADAQITAAFDAAFSKYPQIFGEGDAATVKAKSPKLFKRRAMAFAEAGQGLGKLRDNLPALLAAIAPAVEAAAVDLFDYEPEPAPAPAPKPRPRNPYADSTVARPTQRGAARPKKGPAAAQEAFERYVEENGIDLDGDAAEDPYPDSEY